MLTDCVILLKQESLGVKISFEHAQKAKEILLSKSVLAKGMDFAKAGNSLVLPVIKKIKLPFPHSFVKTTFEKRHSTSLMEELKASGKFSEKELSKVVTSFDLIGDVAILEIPQQLVKKQKLIAQALLNVHHNVKSVVKKASAMQGEYRVRKLAHLAGRKNTETIYRESKCQLLFDPAKVYFSVRLSHERERIAGLVKKNERILALFAGVGPFPLVIAKNNLNKNLILAAVELNPVAVKYLRKNIELNHLQKFVQPIEGDANKVLAGKKYRKWADRVLMPLPKSSNEFLPNAIKSTKKGGVIHYYCFASLREQDVFSPAVSLIKKECLKQKRGCRILFKRIVRPYAPYVSQIAIDFKVN